MLRITKGKVSLDEYISEHAIDSVPNDNYHTGQIINHLGKDYIVDNMEPTDKCVRVFRLDLIDEFECDRAVLTDDFIGVWGQDGIVCYKRIRTETIQQNISLKNGPRFAIGLPKKSISTLLCGNPEVCQLHIDVDKKFNWFQKKMIKWCFGFDVKENK